MDLNPSKEVVHNDFVGDVKEDIVENIYKGKRQCYPFPSSTSSSSFSSSSHLVYNRGFIALSNNHHHSPHMAAWLRGGDHNFIPDKDTPVGSGYSSGTCHEFTDLSMNMECCEEDQEEEGDDGKSSRKEAVLVKKEHMFDKVVTPSDVGKLNRLVIPKQHAERFFPLDSSSTDKGGLLLSFEDWTGKPWRFRYSYWNSSQSYVMTKGWSRFVKDKKLDAGDLVSFHRGVGDAAKDRLFIDWAHKPKARGDMPISINYPGILSFSSSLSFHRPVSTGMWNYPSPFQSNHHQIGLAPIRDGGLNRYGTSMYRHVMKPEVGDGSVVYMRPSGAAVQGRGNFGCGIGPPVVFESVPVVQGTKAAVVVQPTKRQLRLFGVNMDCASSMDSNEQESQTNPSASQSHNQYQEMSVYDGKPVPNGWLDKGKQSTSLDFGI